MPKLKTLKSAAKRFAKTGTGKIIRSKGFKRHILTHKSRKTKRAPGDLAQTNLPWVIARLRCEST